MENSFFGSVARDYGKPSVSFFFFFGSVKIHENLPFKCFQFLVVILFSWYWKP